ncbi:hypothetical protein EDB81DRAFT_668861, partial [Dactylonectria macrodidyma]
FGLNGHYYRDGHLRAVEDIYTSAKWSNIVHLQIMDLMSTDSTRSIRADIALTGLHNNNGIGNGEGGEILISSCGSGSLHIGALSGNPQESRIEVLASKKFYSYIDNPSWFKDPFRTGSLDGSGFILPGILSSNKHIIGGVVRQTESALQRKGSFENADCWETRLLFEDDGSRLSAASSIVLVTIDPELENGNHRAWLFVSGLSKNIISGKVTI